MATKPYTYTRDDLMRLADASNDKLRQDVSRSGFAAGEVGEAAVWLAKYGNPELRQRIAEQVLPEIVAGVTELIRAQLSGAFVNKMREIREKGKKTSRTKQRQNGKPKLPR